MTDRGVAVAAAIVTQAERDAAAAEAPTGVRRGGRNGAERGYCGEAIIVLRNMKTPSNNVRQHERPADRCTYAVAATGVRNSTPQIDSL